MCFGDNARPPAPPVRLPVADHGELTLTSADGTRFVAYHARAEQAAAPAVVILPDVRGLHTYYTELAVRFAEAGLHAVAIDYFGRTTEDGHRGEDFPAREHVDQTKPGQVAEDTAAAVAWLRQQPGVRSVFTVGFCFGGSSSWAQSAAGDGLAGCIGFYGNPVRIADRVAEMRDPLLILTAGADAGIPVESVEHFADEVRAHGVPVELEVFPGAPHSFFDRSFGEHREACDRAWRLMLEFTQRWDGPA